MVGKPWETDISVYDDEAALLAGLRRRDRLACDCLLKRHAPALYRLALRLVADPDEAEDVLQESFIRACDTVASFEGRSGLATWLHRIVLNTALMHLRRRKGDRVPLAESRDDTHAPLAETLPSDAPDPGGVALTSELRETVERALLGLPETLRVAFVLRDVEGLSTREAAAALGIGESALKVRLHRAHLALRAALAPYLHEATGASVGRQP
jgi:RNA polymerase sigma-70 factor (ECF subfamily)